MEDGGKPYLIIALIAIIVVLAIALAVVLYTFRKSIVKKVNNYKNKNNTSEEDVKQPIQSIIDELKEKESILKEKLYKQTDRIRKAFPTMKSEKFKQISKYRRK